MRSAAKGNASGNLHVRIRRSLSLYVSEFNTEVGRARIEGTDWDLLSDISSDNDRKGPPDIWMTRRDFD